MSAVSKPQHAARKTYEPQQQPPLPPSHTAQYPPEIRVYLITLLNQTLACTVDLRSHATQAYWNVKGTDFIPWHVLFATMASELDVYANLIAERIAVLGGVTRGTARMAATQSMLPEYPSDLVEGGAYVLALAERFAFYAMALRAGISGATDVEDAGSAAVYTDISRGVEKRLWFLEAHLYQCGAAQTHRVEMAGRPRVLGGYRHAGVAQVRARSKTASTLP